jgi:predicted enzyme related to lactoylglutathione lyase
MDIPKVGRFAVLQDPTGAVVAVFRSATSEEAPSDEVAPGAMVWHECYAGDLEQAWSFYSALFGWEVADTMDMGPRGEYRMYRAPGSKVVLGGMMTRPEQMPRPMWLFYAHVDDIASAAARVKSAGGQVTMGPMRIPGGEYTLMGLDPQGAMFALHSKVNSAS